MTVTYLDRADWGAGPVTVGRSAPHSQFIGLVAHHTVYVSPDYDHDGTVDGDLNDVKAYMRWLQHARPDLGPDVPYSFVVFHGEHPGDCVVAEGRGFGRTGAHTTGFNSSRYGVALAGNSSTRPVTDGILDGYRWVGRRLADPAGAERTLGHRDTKATECPGTSLYAALPQIQPPFTDPEEDDDMTLDQAYWDRMSRLVDGRLRDPDNLAIITDAVLDRIHTGGYKASGSDTRTTLQEMAVRGVNLALGAAEGDKTYGLLDERLQELETKLDAALEPDPAPGG